MRGEPVVRVPVPGAEVVFMLGGADWATTESFDLEVRLDDGSRWSGTVLTLDEVRRVMDQYFSCPDLLIVERGGMDFTLELVRRLVADGEIGQALARIDEDED